MLSFLPARSGAQTVAADSDRVQTVVAERQPSADLGNGYYRNPVIAGGYADPSLVRIGRDYYMVHGGGQARGMLIWHSRDLVNWGPLTRIHVGVEGDIWAPELVYYRDLFYLYLPIMVPRPDGSRRAANYVMTAKSLQGPWGEPVDLHVDGLIDPGHVVDEQGNRYLYLSAGNAVPLAPDGLRTTGELKKVYEGWLYPQEWVVECFCLESPKLIRWEGYYYLISAQGGTAGPSTGHMIAVARSKSPLGPWENSPFNPMVRTRLRTEGWWSQGHGTLIDDVEGKWWVVTTGLRTVTAPSGVRRS
jgi:beta-xylosidase